MTEVEVGYKIKDMADSLLVCASTAKNLMLQDAYVLRSNLALVHEFSESMAKAMNAITQMAIEQHALIQAEQVMKEIEGE